MANGKQKNNMLKLTDIKKSDKEYDKQEEFEFEDGKKLKYYPLFRPSRIEDLLEEMREKLIYAEEKGINIDEKDLFNFVLFYCIKYFTALKSQISDELEKQIQEMQWLLDSNYFKPIIEEAFDKKEINKVWDKIADLMSVSQFEGKLKEMIQEKVDSLELQNRDILFPQKDTENKVVQ